MKKYIQITCCALGSGMIGYFANQLDSIMGIVFFTIGIVMLAGSIVIISKHDKANK